MTLLLLLACAAATSDSGLEEDGCLPGHAPSLTIGTGESAYEPLDGEALELVHGPQGGFHVVLALEARHVDTADTVTAHLQGYIEDELHAETFPYANFRCNHADDALQAWNLFLVWDLLPEELDGAEANVAVGLTDATGVELTAEADFLIHDPTLD